MKILCNPIQLVAAAFFAATALLAPAATINVPADYPDIIDAVYAANPGDTVLIQSGTYNENGQVFVWAPMTLTATNGPVTIHCTSSQEAVAEVASGITGAIFNGITFERLTADANWMRCFQINNSAEATFNNCTFQGPANGVGVIQFFGGSGTYNSCTFSNFNPTAPWAAAIFVEGANAAPPNSDVIVSNCTFGTGCNSWIRTSPFQDPPRIGSVIVQNSTFKAALNPQALAFWDGGLDAIIYSPTNSLLFQDCTFEGPATNSGGLDDEVEFYYTTNSGPASLTFSRCDFKAYNSNSKMFYLALPAPITFENCLFAGGQHESVMTVWGGPPVVNFYYCTMINAGTTNGQSEHPGAASSTFIDGWDNGRTFNIVDSLFRCPTNYSAGFVCDPTSTGIRNYVVSNSVIDHPIPTGNFAEITLGTGGYTNVSLASAFVDPASGNYQLTDGLPWVNGGIDLGYTLDLADNPRIQGGAPDMGAYESSFSAQVPTISITNNAGNLQITFVGILQSATQVQGPFSDVQGAVSPLTVSVLPAGEKFWRARTP